MYTRSWADGGPCLVVDLQYNSLDVARVNSIALA
jgi:hypothetical protein